MPGSKIYWNYQVVCVVNKIGRAKNIFLTASFLFPILFILFLIMAQWPRWWIWTVPELTPLAWMQSVLLFLTGVMAFESALLADWGERKKESINWVLLGIGFFYFCLDERFAFHERLRDKVLVPLGFKIRALFWVAPGDYLMLAFMVVGIALVPRFIRLFNQDRKAKKLFFAAIGLSAVAIIADSFSYKAYSIEVQRLEQFWEQMVKTTAMVFFLNAFAQRFLSQMGDALNNSTRD
jgi:hypothetical protein